MESKFKKDFTRLLLPIGMLVTLSTTSLANTVCTKYKITSAGSVSINSEMMYAMDGAINSGEFDPTLPFEVTSIAERCKTSKSGEKTKGKRYSLQDEVPPPSITPKEGDIKTITQTRSDGTRTYTYTYMNGVWVLTRYEFAPATTPEAPEEP